MAGRSVNYVCVGGGGGTYAVATISTTLGTTQEVNLRG